MMTRSGRQRWLPAHLFQQGLDRGQDLLNDDLDPFGVWMQPVRLIELRIARDVLKKERIERNIVLLR